MNLLKFLPKKLRNSYIKNLENSGVKIAPIKYITRTILFGFIFSVIITSVMFFFKINPLLSFLLLFLVIETALYLRISLKASSHIKSMEMVFPDFIQLMSSNLRAGMTVDHAFLSSARPELAPLDEEILKTGREIATGADVVTAFRNMGKRINSEKINKTVYLIISGLKAGGNISTLLESTASSMREMEFLEKRAASNVLMYVIFIFAAIGVGAPVLFGLSSVLVQIIIDLSSQLPAVENVNINLPFTLSNVGLSPVFVIYFSIIFLITTDFISALVIGLVNKGDEKYGFKYIFPLIVFSLGIFFLVRFFLNQFLADTFSAIS